MIVRTSRFVPCDTDPVTATLPTSLCGLRDRFEDALTLFLDDVRAEIAAEQPEATVPLDEIRRLLAAGGKRLRPGFCYWGHRAAGGEDGVAIVRASAALELLHTMALIHDDLMDGTPRRRGVASSAAHLAALARREGLGADPEGFGLATAILSGDLAAVLADRMLLESGFDAGRIAAALAPYHRMRTEMALGQYLDVAGLAGAPGADPDLARRAARLKGGSYTVEGPLTVGAALAGATPEVIVTLMAFGSPLGEAFQLRDDVVDGDGSVGITAADVNALVHRARAVLDPAVLRPGAVEALDALAASLEMA
jgi:geranylgeranyl diphosphate synthase type I